MRTASPVFLLAAAVALTVHGTVCAARAAGGLSLLFLTHEVYGDGNDNGYPYNANKDSAKVGGKKSCHGNSLLSKN